MPNQDHLHTLLIVGDGEVATALATLAATLGWEPVVVDSLPDAISALPQSDSVVVLSHHDGIDGPALAAALTSGADTPAEIAVSVVAEVIAVSHGRSGGGLRDRTGSIHP